MTAHTRRTASIAALVREGQYVVDPGAVAAAMRARAALKALVPSTQFRSDERLQPVRSFRATRQASSFRLAHGSARRR